MGINTLLGHQGLSGFFRRSGFPALGPRDVHDPFHHFRVARGDTTVGETGRVFESGAPACSSSRGFQRSRAAPRATSRS